MKRYISYAAIIIVLFSSITAIFAMINDFSFSKFFSNEDELGYPLQIKVDKIDHNDFNGEISEVKDIILNQQKNYEPYMSSYPLEYTKYFDTIGESMNYLGIDISYLTLEEDVPATMQIMCNASGDIVQITIMTDYIIYGNNVQVWYYIFSDLKEDPYYEVITEDELMAEKINYQVETISFSNGQQIPLILSEKNDDNIEIAKSCFSQSDIVYSIHVAADADKEMAAKDTLLEVLQLLRQ